MMNFDSKTARIGRCIPRPDSTRRCHFPRLDCKWLVLILATIVAFPTTGSAQVFTGDMYASSANIQIQNTTTWVQMLSDRLATNFSSPGCESSNQVRCIDGTVFANSFQLASTQSGSAQSTETQLVKIHQDSTSDWTGWAQGYGLGGAIQGNSTAGGTNFRTGGTIFGIDRRLDENIIVGVFGGYTGTSSGDVSNSSSARIDDYQVGLYEAWGLDQFYLSNTDAFSNDTSGVSRPPVLGVGLGTASANSSGNQWTHYSEAGMTFGANGFRVQPFVGLQYLYLDRGGFTEVGASPTNLTSGHQYVNSLRGSIGLRVSKDLVWNGIILTPMASARYQREMDDGQPTINTAFTSAPATSFPTAGNYLGRDFGYLNLGANAKLTEYLSLYGNCGAQVSDHFAAVTGTGGFQLRW